jgi:MFS transporter, MHS family, proline/betaine transporter
LNGFVYMKSNRAPRDGLSWKGIIGSTIGNALEWYDFLIFGYLAVLISEQFFPSKNPLTSMLLATATFGVGFIFRPIAGIAIGMYADRSGRKKALLLVIVLMFISTAMLAFAPTYQQAGMWAPVMVVTSRVLQGISAGGEFGGATALLIESAKPGQRGFHGSWQMFAQAAGSLLAVFCAAMLTNCFTHEALTSWAWRLPFFVGLLIGPVGYWIRRGIDESEEFSKIEARPSMRFQAILVDYRPALLVSMALGGAASVMVYVLTGYMPIYAVQTLMLTPRTPFIVLSATLPVRMLFIPFFGHLADKYGGKAVMGVALLTLSVFSYPAFSWLAHEPSLERLMAVELVLAVIMAAILGPFPSMLAELFPTEIRSTGMSLTYNLTASLLGGFSPFILTWLVAKTGDPMVPSYYMTAFIVVGAIALLRYKQREPETRLAVVEAVTGGADRKTEIEAEAIVSPLVRIRRVDETRMS